MSEGVDITTHMPLAGEWSVHYHGLAELQRLNILPKAYVYDAQLRPVRDLLRRRRIWRTC